MTPAALQEPNCALTREAATGINGKTWREYETDLAGRLHDRRSNNGPLSGKSSLRLQFYGT